MSEGDNVIPFRHAPERELPLSKRLACAVIALGQHERQMGGPCLVALPLANRLPGEVPLTALMLGEILIDAGEELLSLEPSARLDPTLEPPRERFLNLVREVAKELESCATKKPRLVRPDGSPARR